MFLTDNQFNNIRGIFLNGQSGLEAKAGGLIYSSDTSKDNFVLISKELKTKKSAISTYKARF